VLIKKYLNEQDNLWHERSNFFLLRVAGDNFALFFAKLWKKKSLQLTRVSCELRGLLWIAEEVVFVDEELLRLMLFHCKRVIFPIPSLGVTTTTGACYPPQGTKATRNFS
jgi:hypothetical protein